MKSALIASGLLLVTLLSLAKVQSKYSKKWFR
jgi:hypothetical protein